METQVRKITIESNPRPCIVNMFKAINDRYENGQIIGTIGKSRKALFHMWVPHTGNALVEYEDGTVHEVDSTQIRFLDNAVGEYAYPEMEKCDEPKD